MKRYPLQLVTVNLENGQQGVFIGLPLVSGDTTDSDSQVEELWFSDVQEVPAELTLAQILGLVRQAVCGRRERLN